MSGSLPQTQSMLETDRFKSMLDRFVTDQAQSQQRNEPPSTRNQRGQFAQFQNQSSLPLSTSVDNSQSPMNQRPVPPIEMNTQTSAWLLHDQSQQPQQPPNPNSILLNPNRMDPRTGKVTNFTWSKRFQYEIKTFQNCATTLRNNMSLMNIAEANLRDRRDIQAKAVLNVAYALTLTQETAKVFGEMASNQATISSYHDAMLSRVEVRVIQELQLLPDMVKQISAQLATFNQSQAEYEKKYKKFQAKLSKMQGFGGGSSSGGLMKMMGFGANNPQNNGFTPRPMSAGQPYGMGGPAMGGMSNMQVPQNSDVRLLARRCKENLMELESLTSRYITEVYEILKKVLIMRTKSYLEYHIKCVEIFAKELQAVSNIDTTAATQGFIKNLGIPELHTNIEAQIMAISNQNLYQNSMSMWNQPQQMQMQPQSPFGQPGFGQPGFGQAMPQAQMPFQPQFSPWPTSA